MAEQQPWEKIVERNRAAEALPRVVYGYTPSAERMDLSADAGQIDKAMRRIATLEQRMNELEVLLSEETQRRVKFEQANTHLERAVKSLGAKVAALTGEDTDVFVPGNGVDRQDEWVPAEYAQRAVK